MNKVNYDELLELVKNRRSVRWFKPDSIPDEYIDKIIEVARWAPSGFHTQPWEFVVIKKKELRNKIADIARRPGVAPGQAYFEKAPFGLYCSAIGEPEWGCQAIRKSRANALIIFSVPALPVLFFICI